MTVKDVDKDIGKDVDAVCCVRLHAAIRISVMNANIIESLRIKLVIIDKVS